MFAPPVSRAKTNAPATRFAGGTRDEPVADRRNARLPAPAGAAWDFAAIPIIASGRAGGGASPQDAMGTTDPAAADAGAESGADAAPKAAPPSDAGTAAAAAPEAGAPEAEPPGGTAPAAPGGALSWTHVLQHKNDALWWFNGEHPSGFSIAALLRASGYGDPTHVVWRIAQGADKVAFQGANTGAEVHVRSTASSVKADDVTVEAKEGAGAAARVFSAQLTVLAPHHLIHRSDTDHGTCPPWGACTAGCSVYWTEIGYRVVDNVGGTIVGATVNENFPGAPAADQANNWVNPAAFATVPFWRNTNGTFVDNWFVFCGNPAPVAPGAAGAGASVDHMPHEFYVGSDVPTHGVRVQTHTAHRYLGFARHEAITTPAP